ATALPASCSRAGSGQLPHPGPKGSACEPAGRSSAPEPGRVVVRQPSQQQHAPGACSRAEACPVAGRGSASWRWLEASWCGGAI
ncbi:hypothetical protein HaLaN_21708, partial [Haematococcus lacustris]